MSYLPKRTRKFAGETVGPSFTGHHVEGVELFRGPAVPDDYLVPVRREVGALQRTLLKADALQLRVVLPVNLRGIRR
jgi:hypothetical protein